MGELKAALEDALSGHGRLVTPVGEPGIGKTRTSEELATYARMRGAHVLWGRCHESRGAPPYWPWVQAIRSYVREQDPDQVHSEMGTGAADIAEIVSDVRERIPDLKASPTLDDPEQARFRLFDSVTAFLKSASRTRPLLVILDNLHWADRSSLLLLEFLAQELASSRLLVIGTYRDVNLSRQHPLVETLGELTRERLFQRVLLRGLSEQDVARFIETTSGLSSPTRLVSAVDAQTEGNPLFVTEVVRLLVQEGELTREGVNERDSWEVRIPEGVREVIGRRLNRLSARCNETLTIAAAIGREFEKRQLERLVEGVSEDRLLEVGRYQFTHALIQQTLYDELTTTRRVRLNARIVGVFEEIYADNLEIHAHELAYYASEAEAFIGSDKLVTYSKLAGERALAAYAYEEALNHLQRGLAAREELPVNSETADMLFGLGFAREALADSLDQRQRAWDEMPKAFDYYLEAGDVSKAVAVAAHPVAGLGYIERPTQVSARALEMVSPDSHDAGRLWSRHGSAIFLESGEYHEAQAALSRAIEIAQREDDAVLEARALAYAASIDWHSTRYREAIEKSLRAIELARRVNDSQAEVRARIRATTSLLATRDLDEAHIHAIAGLDAAESLRDRWWITATLAVSTLVSSAAGDWPAALEFSTRALAVSPRHPLPCGLLALLECEVGEFERGDAHLDRLLSQTGSSGPELAADAALYESLKVLAIAHGARITVATKQLDVAVIAARALLSSARVGLISATTARISLALMAVERGDGNASAEQYDALGSQRATMDWAMSTSLDRVLGLLARTMSKLDDADGHFEDALTFCRGAGYRPELAWACCDYADMLLERDAEGDRQKAIALLDESLAISSELGMRPLMERVLSRKMSLQGIDISSPQTSIDAVVSAVEVERPNLQPHAAPDGTVTVMFTDIEGSTAMTERLGDQKAQDVLRTRNRIVREQVAAHQGYEVKSQGDDFMVAFSSARRALQCAIAIQQTLVAHNAENPAEPIRVRIGLHTGEAIKEGEDFFGKSVILAARIASQAHGEQILVSSLLKALVESTGAFEFGDEREMELKGMAGTHHVFEVSLP